MNPEAILPYLVICDVRQAYEAQRTSGTSSMGSSYLSVEVMQPRNLRSGDVAHKIRPRNLRSGDVAHKIRPRNLRSGDVAHKIRRDPYPAYDNRQETPRPGGASFDTSSRQETRESGHAAINSSTRTYDSITSEQETRESGHAAINSSTRTYDSITSENNQQFLKCKIMTLIMILSAIAAAAVVILIFYTNNNDTENSTDCSTELAHFGSESLTKCIYKYTTISKVDVIQLRTKDDSFNFTNPFRKTLMENSTKQNFTETTNRGWSLKMYRPPDNQTVEISFLKNVTDCELIGSYEVVLWRGTDPIVTTFAIDIADDFTTNQSITAFIDDNSVNPTIKVRCDGVLYCKDYAYYKVKVTENENFPSKTENMFCTSNRTIAGVIQTSCSIEWTDSELPKKTNVTLLCDPRVPSNVDTTNNSSQENNHPYDMKEICANRLTAGFGDFLRYFCRKRLHTTYIHSRTIRIDFLKNQEHILNITLPTDGTSQNISKGRYRLYGHIDGEFLDLNITFKEVYHCDYGVYKVRVTNASDISFELRLPELKNNNCKSSHLFTWQQYGKYSCQFCSEKDVSLFYEKDGSRSNLIPSKKVEVTKQFKFGLVELDFIVTNMSCDTTFVVFIVGNVNRTFSFITEVPFVGKVEKTFSNEFGINLTMKFRHILGCFAKIILPIVTGKAVIQYTQNVSYTDHNGKILENLITYQTSAFNGSLVSSVVTYSDHNMKVKRSEDHFIVIHIPDDFCMKRKQDCNYKHPSFYDRFVSCPSNVSLPVEQHCVEGTIWDDPDGDCRGRCE